MFYRYDSWWSFEIFTREWIVNAEIYNTLVIMRIYVNLYMKVCTFLVIIEMLSRQGIFKAWRLLRTPEKISKACGFLVN